MFPRATSLQYTALASSFLSAPGPSRCSGLVRCLHHSPRLLQPPRPHSHLTPAEQKSKRVEESDTGPPPPYLSRALGVQHPPTKGEMSREEWRANLLSKERRLGERKHLVQQVSKGYFHDYNQLRTQGGKGWMAPNTLIREDLALYFPDIAGQTLSPHPSSASASTSTSKSKNKAHTTDFWPGKVSLVVLSSFRSSEEHVNSFVRPTLADLEEDPLFQYVYINLQENPLKSFLVSMFLSSLRAQIPPPQQPTYLLSHQSLEYLREPMGMTNKHVGYVFLVDWEGRIRWAGCGWASPEEEEGLRRCSWVLRDRLAKGKGTGKGNVGDGDGISGVKE